MQQKKVANDMILNKSLISYFLLNNID